MLTFAAKNDFSFHLPHICKLGVSSAEFSYWKIGGPVALLVEPSSVSELAMAIKIINKHPNVPSLVIGDSSNLLYDSAGFQGVLVKIGKDLSGISINGTEVICEAGVWVPELAYRVSALGLSGIEHICGIPGRIGGLIYMNGGSDRRSVLENIASVELINKHGRREIEYQENLLYSYRTSPFQGDSRIIARATFTLEQSTRANVRSRMRKILSSRRKRFPRKQPNCGSVFLSDPKIYDTFGPPGAAIERAGLKGRVRGGAQISTLHANFIVNNGSASSDDVLYLIKLMRETVYKETSFYMDCEARYVSPKGELIQAHFEADRRWAGLNV